jgi:L-amino acid N-acyltransferase YncA
MVRRRVMLRPRARAASVGLHEAVGFVALGEYRNVGFKHGAWRDSL